MSSPLFSPPNTHVPAWKRLGLKLRAATESQPDASTSHTSVNSIAIDPPISALQDRVSASAKRKPSDLPASKPSAKKPRKESSNGEHLLKTSKSVSFAAAPVELSPSTATTNVSKPPSKQKLQKSTNRLPADTGLDKPARTLAKKQNSVNLQAAVDYLRRWHSQRDQWKFNKNHQTRLLESVFGDDTTIPAVDINKFYEYIRPLKGFVRERLRETAAETRKKDMEQGPEAFTSSSKEVAARKQKEYEELIAGFLRVGRTPEKRRFDEVDYVLRTADMEMQRRVVKRMRTEMVIDELSDSEDSEGMTSSVAGTETEPHEEQKSGPSERDTAAEGDKRVKLNDGTQRRIRRNKVRTTEVEDEESSSSDSDSDDAEDTSSSGSDSSSDDSDSDTAMQVDLARNEAETSSSSSSSSSDADSDSGDESSDGDD